MYGKYSPTVFGKTFVPTEPNGIWDADGFDSYGYNAEGYDRAGKREYDYQQQALREFLVDEGRGDELDWENEGGQ